MAALVVLTAFFGISTPAQASSHYTTQDLRLSGAGGVFLDSTIYLPSRLPAPAILLAHGFSGDKKSVSAQAEQLASHGYVVLAWTARGFGNSTGEISMNAPTGEVADVSKLIDYLATRKDVIQQGKGDPLVSTTTTPTPPATITGGTLPKTSSPWFNILLIGIGAMVLGGLVLGLKRSPKI